MAVIIAAGQQIVWLILSSEFAPAATLLILLVPAELARTIAETVGLSLLARRRIVPYTLTYFVFVMIFVGGSIETIDRFGLAGIAASYLTAQITTCIVVLGFAARMLQLRLEPATVRGCVAGVVLLTAVGVASWSAPPVATRAAVLLFALAAWAISRWLDPHAGDMTFLRSWVKGRRPSAP
jgi:O-antigen/teichoic acid export membrane protein